MKNNIKTLIVAFAFLLLLVPGGSVLAEEQVSITVKPVATALYSPDDNKVSAPGNYMSSPWPTTVVYYFDLSEYTGIEDFITEAKARIYNYNKDKHTATMYKSWYASNEEMPEIPVMDSSLTATAEWKTYFTGLRNKRQVYFNITGANKEELSTLETPKYNMLELLNAGENSIKHSLSSNGIYSLFIYSNDANRVMMPSLDNDFVVTITFTYDKEAANISRAQKVYNEKLKKYENIIDVLEAEDSEVENINASLVVVESYLAEISDESLKAELSEGIRNIKDNIVARSSMRNFEYCNVGEFEDGYDYYLKFTGSGTVSLKIAEESYSIEADGEIIVKITDKRDITVFEKDKINQIILQKEISGEDITADGVFADGCQRASENIIDELLEKLSRMSNIIYDDKADGDDVFEICTIYGNLTNEYEYLPDYAYVKKHIAEFVAYINDREDKYRELKTAYEYLMEAEKTLVEEDYNKAVENSVNISDVVFLERLDKLKAKIESTVPYVLILKIDGDWEVGSVLTANPDIVYPNGSVGEVEYSWTVGGNEVSTEKTFEIKEEYKNKSIYCYVTPSNSFGVKGEKVKSIQIFAGDLEEGKFGTMKLYLNVTLTDKTAFSDISGHWAESIINIMSNNGIVNGVDEKYFEPERPITRAEFSALLMRALEPEAKYRRVFEDVSETDWFAGYVMSAYNNGIVRGYNGDMFMPANNISREETAAILVRAYELYRGDISGVELTALDRDEISEWAYGDIEKVYSAGIMNGNDENRFLSKKNLTRAEAASAVYNFLGMLQAE